MVVPTIQIFTNAIPFDLLLMVRLVRFKATSVNLDMKIQHFVTIQIYISILTDSIDIALVSDISHKLSTLKRSY